MQHGYQFKNSKIKSQTNKLYMHLVAVKCITCDATLSHKYWKNIAHQNQQFGHNVSQNAATKTARAPF